MPAKSLLRSPEKGTNSHVYNKGAANRIIFGDDDDYSVFVAYLGEYLSAPHDPSSLKKDFTVKGRTYKGTPHLPKNYFGKIQLLAFSLFPDHFHLLLHQVEEKAIESFIRSLCTRYSIYFNRKYKHSGALFEGPYKSAKIETSAQLAHLTAHIQNGARISTYPEYSGKKQTSWVNTKIVLSALKEEGAKSFVDLQKKHQAELENGDLLLDIVLENIPHTLAKTDTKPILASSPRKHEALNAEIVRLSRTPEYVSLIVLFFMLVGVGYSNVRISSAQDTQETQVLAVTTVETPSPAPLEPVEEVVETLETPSPLGYAKVTVIAESALASVNIRKEPTAQSEKIGEAKSGDVFDLVSLHPGWLEIKLLDDTGFISADYAFIY